MANFNTNQALHLYVAEKYLGNYDPETTAPSDYSIGDIALGKVLPHEGAKADEIFFVYKNGDGIVTRTDSVKLSRVKYANVASPDKLAIKLRKATVTISDDIALEDLKGKHLGLTVNLREFIGLEYSERYPIYTDIYCSAAVVASEEAFYAALAEALEDAIGAFQQKPFAVESSASGLVIKQVAQRFVRGKLQADPINFEVVTSLVHDSNSDYELINWGKVKFAVMDDEFVSGDYRLADLERYSYGERGDVYGESVWPMNYEHEYLIKPVAGEKNYGVLTIQYFYCGDGNEIQQSERTLQIAAKTDVLSSIKEALADYMDVAGSLE